MVTACCLGNSQPAIDIVTRDGRFTFCGASESVTLRWSEVATCMVRSWQGRTVAAVVIIADRRREVLTARSAIVACNY